MARIAVLNEDKCKPKKCGLVCMRFCPMVKSRVEAIRLEDDKPIIVESLCVGCGICVRKCPFKALSIVNVPDELESDCSHRYGVNAFKLYRLPTPMPGEVLGLLGKNGIGKSTVLNIFSGKIKPNLGSCLEPPDWPEIIQHFRGSTLQEYFKRLSEGRIKVAYKPQYVDKIPKVVKGDVRSLLERVDERGVLDEAVERLNLKSILDREISVLSGGELQRVAIAAVMCREADVYLFDEPSSYLDVKQRLIAAKAIRTLIEEDAIVLVAEHDLATLDYLSDKICILYGEPGVYGVVSNVHGVRVGINHYMEGYIPDENVRFRSFPIHFKVKTPASSWIATETLFEWGEMEKRYGKFTLKVHEGNVGKGEVIGILGANGIGKTTFIKLLAGVEKPDAGREPEIELSVSYKPQYISSEYGGKVEDLLKSVAKEEFSSSWYTTEILTPLSIGSLLEKQVSDLSGGELQRVAIAACLSKKVDVYLLDEPSAYLDVEERLNMARTIRRVVESRESSAFVVEHDVFALDFIADRLMVFTGEPGVKGVGYSPTSLRDGMNMFLKEIGVTFRRDPTTYRPRVNKEGSKLDRLQKEMNEYFYMTVVEEKK
ncbi:ribosome biogenesis/translation initiation ATPase RLI [Candidatus Bathyarchaeota archaeon]|nr:ribosome biogenesis/translation initiation ATPase RLI [Candidatus Bathyarchaeota archaeon]